MKKILVINASARTLHSKSRKLTEVFIEQWKSIHQEGMIHFRELGNDHVAHINENWIAAAAKSEVLRSAEEIEILKPSNTYISELREADIIVLGTPMYNWSIPSTLKAYIDQVLRYNETYTGNPGNVAKPYAGLLKNKTLFLLLSRGSDGYEKGGNNEQLNFQSTYLKTVFNVMGITNIHMVAINGASMNSEQLIKNISSAHQDIKDLVAKE